MSRISTSTPTLDRMTRMVSEDQSPQRRRNGISRNPSDASLISKESITSLRSQRFELVFTIFNQSKVAKYQTVCPVCVPFSKNELRCDLRSLTSFIRLIEYINEKFQQNLCNGLYQNQT